MSASEDHSKRKRRAAAPATTEAAAPADESPISGLLWKAQKVLFYIGAVYAIGILLLLVPPIQRQVVFMHNVRWPLFARFDAPHYHGLAPFKTLDFKITTADNVKLGSWFVLSEPAYRASEKTGPPTSEEVRKALHDHPTVLFFHGNAASRAVKYRVQFYGQVSARLRANVLVIDYRGFADSTGSPTEAGLNIDSRAAWDWLISNGADPSSVIIFGQSLGTGVSSKLVSQLAQEGMHPRAVALTAPFSSIGKLMETYSFGGYVPVLRPLQSIPFAVDLALRFIHTRFSTIDLIADIKCPLLIVHAKDDTTIPPSHSVSLFDKLLDPYLPGWPFDMPDLYSALQYTVEQINAINEAGEARRAKGNELAPPQTIGTKEAPFGVVRELKREDGGKVIFLETEKGGHSEIVRWEGVIDFVGKIAGI